MPETLGSTLAVLIRASATSGEEERVPTGGELTRNSRCRP